MRLLDYDLIDIESNLVKMDIMLNGEVVDALSIIAHKEFHIIVVSNYREA